MSTSNEGISVTTEMLWIENLFSDKSKVFVIEDTTNSDMFLDFQFEFLNISLPTLYSDSWNAFLILLSELTVIRFQ